MAELEVEQRTAPAHWASYLVNGDASGLGADEQAAADRWVKRLSQDGWRVVSAEGEAWFAHSCDALRRFNGDIIEYVLHRSPEQPEAALQERDDRVVEEIKRVLKYKEDLARQMREDARQLENQAKLIREAVRAQKYYLLPDFGVGIEPDDVESLCGVSPDLSEEIQ